MNKQKGFSVPRSVIIISLIVLGLMGWIVVQGLNKPSSAPSQSGGQVVPDTANAAELQKAQVDSQVKNDLARAAVAVAEFASNNSGSYPASTMQAEAVIRDYITSTKSFISPITDGSYTLVLGAARAQGVINLEAGTCNAKRDGVVPTQNSSTYAVLTQLVDKSIYCVDI